MSRSAVADRAAGGAPRAARRAPHLAQVDVVRLVTFASVIGVHSVALGTPGSSWGAGTALVLLHFTRATFFVLSAFVLVHAQGDRPLAAGRFYRRRLAAVGVPYLVWTVLYWVYDEGAAAWSPQGLGELVHDAWSGDAALHLYFLLVSLQLYLLFPLLLALVRRTRGHHAALLAVSAAVQVALLAALHLGEPPAGAWAGLAQHADAVALTYPSYVVVGALAAVHRERLDRWVRRHRGAVVAVLGAAAALDLGVYALQVPLRGDPRWASETLQPVVAVWSVAVTLGLYALGCAYAERTRAGRLPRLRRIVTEGSRISFGVYLVHALVLLLLLRWGLGGADPVLAPPAAAGVAWVGTAVLSVVVAEVLWRTPLSWVLTGRDRRRPGGAAA